MLDRGSVTNSSIAVPKACTQSAKFLLIVSSHQEPSLPAGWLAIQPARWKRGSLTICKIVELSLANTVDSDGIDGR